MTENDVIAFVGLLITVAFTVPTTMWVWTRRSRGQELKPGSSLSDERLARIETAVEAMAIEIERISEGQRFTTKLLTERAAVPPSERAALPPPEPRESRRA